MTLTAKLHIWLLKRVSQEKSVTLSSRGIYILPTKEGVIFALLILLMLSAAINFNNSLIFFCTFLLAGMGIISMHMTQQNLLNLKFSIAHVKAVFSGQALSLPLIIHHAEQTQNKKNTTRYSIAIQFSKAVSPAKELTDVRSDENSQVLLSTLSSQRGHYQLEPITISTLYPLGLFRAWTNIQLDCDAIVYPKPSDAFEHTSNQGSNSEGQTDKGRGFDDFSGFKSYQRGESLKHIHWKAYAREQGLLTKTFSGANNNEYWLDWNDLSGDNELRLSQLCRLIIDAEKQGDRYGLVLPGTTLPIQRGQKHYQQCLKSLALFRQADV
ncbi:DUF58 domain-containing protein [sulfur-oxidizing endosymbiont of Gigantopelta aegis]|uniref:DUF58 domain-containing protein n=1 Tax=sulfur-oxidizing endosymbiont of Gigantopelta aegis TaxID=2794934 RepID=UPI0018DB4C69|nr:DUF58 domain-containing protein [sulfur-oxidizing endosymbiont of Gigantopelta aegis]